MQSGYCRLALKARMMIHYSIGSLREVVMAVDNSAASPMLHCTVAKYTLDSDIETAHRSHATIQIASVGLRTGTHYR